MPGHPKPGGPGPHPHHGPHPRRAPILPPRKPCRRHPKGPGGPI